MFSVLNFSKFHTAISPVWIGATYSGGKLTWIDGTAVQSDHELYREIAQQQGSQDMCVTLNTLGK